ncbi:MAG: CHAT domain-containing protein, partial [Myxococcales bacterium]|nr:CHAT domain-containing protein [Myxococcales bacterium]
MGARAALGVVLEFARTDTPEDPHAFRFAPQDYTLRVADGRRARLTVPWDRALLAELAAVRSPSRDPAAAQRIGDRLRGILEPAGWGAIASQIHAAVEEGREVHVTVRSNAAELYALPWELMTLGPSGRHLGELEEVLLRHEWPGTKSTPEQPNPRTEGGRLLFAWSSAAGAVPVDDHLRAIDRACQEGHVAFNPERDVLAHAGVHGLTARLQSARDAGRPVAILHLLCHGAVAGATYGLTLDADDGEAVTVDAGRLRQLLAPFAGSLRLVVLAACDGGNAGDPGNHLGSIAQALHRAGIAAVVASRFPLSADGSGVLAATLYRALLVDLSSLERAFTRARLQLARDPTHLDWASLSLHARADDGDDTRPWIVRPYRGLLAFHAEHTRLFYGRDVERSEILSDLHALIEAGRPRFLVVAGASGTGKSSMVLAGAVPDLLRRGEAALRDEAATKLVARARRDLAAAAERMPGAYLRSALEALERGAAATVGGEWSCRVMRPGDRPMAALTSAIEGHTAGRRLLLVVDQFEELFTLSDDAKLREAFTRRLWSLS